MTSRPGPRMRLKRFMRAKNWTVSQLARAASLHASTVNKIVNGKRSAGMAAALAFEALTAEWESGPIRVEDWRRCGAVSSRAA